MATTHGDLTTRMAELEDKTKVHLLEPSATMIISSEERTLFVGLGERIASLRRASNITQVQLAEALGVSQQTLQSCEVGRRRLLVSALPNVAATLALSLDEPFGTQPKTARGAGGERGPAPLKKQN